MKRLTGNITKQLLFWLLLLIVFNHTPARSNTDIAHPPTLIEDSDDLKSNDAPAKGYQKEIKFVALQVGSNYGSSPLISSQQRFDSHRIVLSDDSEGTSHPLQMDHRIRLQRYIYPFHFFW